MTGFEPGPMVNSGDDGLNGIVTPQDGSSVTGVKAGTSSLAIPYGPRGYVTSADWYFPT